MLMKLNFVQQVIWITAIALTRLSIALSLMRLSHERAWKLILWAVITTQIITYFGHMLFQFANCRPLKANWMPVYDVRCWPRKYVLTFGWVANGTSSRDKFLIAPLISLLIYHVVRGYRIANGHQAYLWSMMLFWLFCPFTSSARFTAPSAREYSSAA